jgi:transcriptional regulator with XRE-family HTH domain
MSNMENAFRRNVPRLLEERGMSQRELAKAIGKSAEHLNAALKGRASISRNLMETIADALGASTQELFTDPGDPGIKTERAEYITEGDIKRIPFLETRVGKDGAATRRSSVTAPVLFKADWAFAVGNPDRMAMVRTAGAALDGEIPDNSLVLVDTSQTVLVSGAPYFLRIGSEFVIKRLITQADTKKAADDRDGAHGTRELADEEDWEIVGRCLWYSRSLS